MTDAEKLVVESRELRRKADELIAASQRDKAEQLAKELAMKPRPTPPPDAPPPPRDKTD